MWHAQFRELSIDIGVAIAMMKIEKVVARQNSLQIFSETPVHVASGAVRIGGLVLPTSDEHATAAALTAAIHLSSVGHHAISRQPSAVTPTWASDGRGGTLR